MSQLSTNPVAPDEGVRAAPIAERDIIECPECGSPAYVEWVFSMSGTSGSVDHVKLNCLSRHHFLMPADRL